MKPAATSKEEILKTCRRMASTQGWNDLNIRNVSSACQVSVGCLYHYFPSKSDLVSATVISIWKEIFHLPEGFLKQNDLKALLKQWYAQMEDVFHTYPGFATMHARLIASNERQESSVFMRRTWKQIVRTITQTIEKDPLFPQTDSTLRSRRNRQRRFCFPCFWLPLLRKTTILP
ncbi:TetR/AcrR family transcriptional regulator [Allobaculum sp. Allo2]|uniref:TetR/AcrR family transcriptional regulator n=1 Tax=Allobaculum sp. Allo2 TaxID=2853432 RepID=UPI001F614C34|nr:TetR/AcrR family transcriptional regulator [Allobaculum sp. Allo2]UNT93796.1 TetR/AcrR family transcriptional regulator [Allobaculum sp. Allo2]